MPTIVATCLMMWMPYSLAVAPDAPAGAIFNSQGSVQRMDFGKTPDGTPVELYVLTNGKITAKVMTYGGDPHRADRARPQREAGGRGSWFRHARGLPGRPSLFRGHHRPGRQPDRQGASSRSTARSTSWPPTTAPTTLHGGLKAFDKVVWKAEDVSGPDGPAVKLHVPQPGRRGRLSRGTCRSA